MAESKQRVNQIEQLIHRTYYLYRDTSNIVIKAECQDKLLSLFRFKNVIENHNRIITMTTRMLKRKSELHRGVLLKNGMMFRSNSVIESFASWKRKSITKKA